MKHVLKYSVTGMYRFVESTEYLPGTVWDSASTEYLTWSGAEKLGLPSLLSFVRSIDKI